MPRQLREGSASHRQADSVPGFEALRGGGECEVHRLASPGFRGSATINPELTSWPPAAAQYVHILMALRALQRAELPARSVAHIVTVPRGVHVAEPREHVKVLAGAADYQAETHSADDGHIGQERRRVEFEDIAAHLQGTLALLASRRRQQHIEAAPSHRWCRVAGVVPQGRRARVFIPLGATLEQAIPEEQNLGLHLLGRPRAELAPIALASASAHDPKAHGQLIPRRLRRRQARLLPEEVNRVTQEKAESGEVRDGLQMVPRADHEPRVPRAMCLHDALVVLQRSLEHDVVPTRRDVRRGRRGNGVGVIAVLPELASCPRVVLEEDREAQLFMQRPNAEATPQVIAQAQLELRKVPQGARHADARVHSQHEVHVADVKVEPERVVDVETAMDARRGEERRDPH
mmetsp:Transcript_21873/g.61122  ORF Transcript_21873/g.61122 Transcript_21873/m.61122 type:complete len:405 (-) Transcript_21873:11-1225(-)